MTGCSGHDKCLNSDYLTVAYDALTGANVWSGQYVGGYGPDFPRSMAVALDGSVVYVTGSSTGPDGFADYATAVYDAATGEELWTARYVGPSGEDVSSAIVVDGTGAHVFVTGEKRWCRVVQGLRDDFVRGRLRVGGMGRKVYVPGDWDDWASAVAVGPDGASACRHAPVLSSCLSGESNYATVAYDANTGAVSWLAKYNGPGNTEDGAESIVVAPDGTQVYVTGFSVNAESVFGFATIAYAS